MSNRVESQIQSEIVEAYRRNGWLAVKLNPGTHGVPNGFPDLMCLGPSGRLLFIEVKQPAGKLTAIQRWTINVLLAMDHEVLVARSVLEGVMPLDLKEVGSVRATDRRAEHERYALRGTQQDRAC